MTWLQFIASIVGSLAWPVAVVVLVALLRHQVKQLLLTITKFKYKDLEIDFGRELKQLTVEAKALDVLPSRPKAVAYVAPPISPGTSRDKLSEADRLVDEFPEPAIAVAWAAVEEGFNSAFRLITGDHSGGSHYPIVKIARDLTKADQLPQGTTDLVKRMTNLRNMAVHGSGGVPITSDEAREFIALSRGLVEKIEAVQKK